MRLQYFVNYNLKKGWALSSSPTLLANRHRHAGKVWTVPFGAGIGRVVKLGLHPVNLSAQFFGNAVHPTAGASWSMRLQVAFLFPKPPGR